MVDHMHYMLVKTCMSNLGGLLLINEDNYARWTNGSDSVEKSFL